MGIENFKATPEDKFVQYTDVGADGHGNYQRFFVVPRQIVTVDSRGLYSDLFQLVGLGEEESGYLPIERLSNLDQEVKRYFTLALHRKILSDHLSEDVLPLLDGIEHKISMINRTNPVGIEAKTTGRLVLVPVNAATADMYRKMFDIKP